MPDCFYSVFCFQRKLEELCFSAMYCILSKPAFQEVLVSLSNAYCSKTIENNEVGLLLIPCMAALKALY